MSFNSVRPISGVSQPSDYNNKMNRVPENFPVNSSSFLNTYKFDKKFLYGHQYLPNQSQSARVLAGSVLDPFDILKGKEVPKEMKDYNDSTVLRARTLSYMESELGMKIPLRLESMGGSMGKPMVPIAPSVPTIEMPEVMIFVPTGIDMTPDMRSWSDEQRYYYAVGDGSYDQSTPSPYANYLSQGGLPIPAMQSIINDHRRKRPDTPESDTFDSLPPLENDPRDYSPGLVPINTGPGQRTTQPRPGPGDEVIDRRRPEETRYNRLRDEEEEKDERAYNEREERDEKIRRKTPRQLFDNIVRGIAKDRNYKSTTIKKDLYHSKGGKEWVADYIEKNGRPKTQDELDMMKREWDRVYTRPGSGVKIEDYPRVGVRPVAETSRPETRPGQSSSSRPTPSRPTPTSRPESTPSTPSQPSQALKDAEKRVRDAKRIINADSGRGLDYIVDEINRERLLPGVPPSDPGQRPDKRSKRPGLGNPNRSGTGLDQKNPIHPEYFATRIPYDVLMGGNEVVREWMIENGIPEEIVDSNDSQIIYDYMQRNDQGPGKPFRTIPADGGSPGGGVQEDQERDRDQEVPDENTPLLDDDPFEVVDIDPDQPVADRNRDKIPPIIPVGPIPIDFDPRKKDKKKPDVPDIPRRPDDPPDDPDGPPDGPDGPVVPSILPSRQPMLQSGHLRPLLKVGGQAVLGLTKRETLQEINNYALFDLPNVPGQDLENPIFLNNVRNQNLRYYAQVPPMGYYAQEPRQMKPVGPRERFEPNFKLACGHPYATMFRDPFDRRRFNKVDPAYRTLGPTKEAIKSQMGNMYPDIAESYPVPAHRTPRLSAAVILLARKY